MPSQVTGKEVPKKERFTNQGRMTPNDDGQMLGIHHQVLLHSVFAGMSIFPTGVQIGIRII